MNVFDRIEAGFDRGVEFGRKRAGWFDHLWRALLRYDEVHGVRLAAAISYYSFFAAFSLTVLAYSILGRLLNSSEAGFIATVNQYLTDQLSWVTQTAEQVGTGQVTILGVIALLLTGVGWIDSLRSSTRAMWLIEQHPGHWILRRVVDLVVLLVLGVLVGLSLAASWAVGLVLDQIAGPGTGTFGTIMVRVSEPALQFVVNLVLSAALLTIVPRLRLSPRRLIPTAVIVAIGIQLLNSLGRWYIAQLDSRPAYYLVTNTVGLLVYLYLLNQLILLGAALAATATAGRMVDHAASASEEPHPRTGEPHGPTGREPR